MIDFTDGGARLHVAVLADAGRLTFTLTGELDGVSGPPLTDVLNTAMDISVEHVDVDMAQVGFADLQGLRALLRGYQACARRGVALMLRDPQPHVAKLLLWFSDTTALLPVDGTASGGTASDGTASADVEACPPAGSRRLSPMTAGEPSPGGPQATDIGHDSEPRPATTDGNHNNGPEPATTDNDHNDRPEPAATQREHERDQRVRQREEEADDRERLMRARDQLLDERQQRVSEHQRWEDIREDLADIRESHLERREHEH